MSGRLPPRYQVTIWCTGLVVFAGVGGWLAWATPVELLWSSGAVIGASLGVFLVSGFLQALRPTSDSDPVANRKR